MLRLDSGVVAHFTKHRQHGKVKTELGGQLFAVLDTGEIHIVKATGPNPIDKRGWSWFRPDLRTQNSEIKKLYQDGLHYVGDWHTHPESTPTPSSLDLTSMEDCFRKSRHELKAFLLVIVGRTAFPQGLWVGLHNSEGHERLLLVDESIRRAQPNKKPE
jgi:integrative and conjugative element protein (TIGR02256 family)